MRLFVFSCNNRYTWHNHYHQEALTVIVYQTCRVHMSFIACNIHPKPFYSITNTARCAIKPVTHPCTHLYTWKISSHPWYWCGCWMYCSWSFVARHILLVDIWHAWLQLQDLQTNARVSHWLAQACKVCKCINNMNNQEAYYLYQHQHRPSIASWRWPGRTSEGSVVPPAPATICACNSATSVATELQLQPVPCLTEMHFLMCLSCC